MTQELWQRLHTAEGDQKLEVAHDLLAVAPQHQICWLFEWLAGAVLNKKNAAVPKEGSQLLCDVLDALPESYPLHSHVSWLLALPLREPSVAPALLERLLKRPPLAFHPSVEQAMAIFQKMSLSECAVRLLLRALESAAPKKAFRAVLDALPVFAGSGEDKNDSQNEEALVALVALLVLPQQLPGFEVLANNWEAASERAAGAEVYQAQLFSCLTKMMAEEKSRRGCCRLLVTFFAALVKAFGRHRAKEQVRQEQREKNLEEKKSPTAVEFLVFVQLWNLLKPWIKADSDAAVESLQRLWQMVRSHSLYRPREDQKGLQSKTLGACCGVLLKRLETSEQSTAEWACLEEMLQLDVAPFESRLQRFWSLLLGPHGASTGAARLGAKLLGTYAQLADLSSCLEALNDATSSQQGGAGSPLLAAPEFLQGLEDAARELTALGQITGTWKMLLKSLKLQLEGPPGPPGPPSSAALLQPVLAGLTPNELCLQPMRDLFHETYDLLMGIQPWPASMDGLLLALCTLGRKLTSWELPSLLSAASHTCERSREGLERLVRSSHPEAAMHCLRAQRDALEKVEAQEVVTAAIQQVERDFSGRSSIGSMGSSPRCVAMLAAVAGAAPGRKRKGSGTSELERLCALLLPEDGGQDLALLFSETETLLESKELCAALMRRLKAQLEELTSEPKVKRRRKSAAERGPLLARLRVLQRVVVSGVPVDRGQLLLLLRRAANTTEAAVAEAALMCLAELLRSHASDASGALEDSFVQDLEDDLRGRAALPVSEDMARALGLCSKALRRSAQGKVKKQSLAQFIAALLGQELGAAAPAAWRTPTPLALLRGAPAPPELPRVLAFLEAGGLTKLEGVLALEMSDDFREDAAPDLHVATVAAAQLLQLLGKEVQLQMSEELSWISYLPDVLRWMKENPGPHLQPLITVLGKQLEGLCKGEGRPVPDKELMDLLMAWAEQNHWEEENEAHDSFACLELWAKRSDCSAEFLERLSLRICSLPSEEASLRPLGSALARLVRGMRSSSPAALVAAQRLLAAAEDATRPSLLLCAADLLLALFAHASGSTRSSGRGLRRDRRHPQLSQLESLLLSCACESARKAPGEAAAAADPKSFLARTTCASKLLSALFKAVPLEAVRLPLWVERPHLLQDALRPILEAVYAAPTGASACLVAQDLARLWEALSQGGARQAVQSAGRTGLTTYQAKVQRATAGFALPLLSHALDQQRRFEGAEAAAKRGRGSATRAEEVAAWKEAVSVLQQGSTSLLNSLEGAEHLLQGLYASLREPLRSMFKELHGGWQKHGRYQGVT